MDLHLLRTYAAVAREGSISAAARAIHRTQPAVSLQLRRLEESVGSELFHRHGRGVTPTEAGKELLHHAEAVLRAADDLEHVVRDWQEVRVGSLSIGTTDVASIYVLPRVYRRFLRNHPGIDLSVQVEGTRALLDLLRGRSIELAVAAIPVNEEDLLTTVIENENLVAILPRKHALAGRKRVRLDELVETPMLTFKKDSVTRQSVDRLFGEAGLQPRLAMEMSSPEAIKKLVEVGLGFAFLPERSVRSEIRAGRLAAPTLVGVNLSREVGILSLKDHYLSPAAESFLSMVGKK